MDGGKINTTSRLIRSEIAMIMNNPPMIVRLKRLLVHSSMFREKLVLLNYMDRIPLSLHSIGMVRTVYDHELADPSMEKVFI